MSLELSRFLYENMDTYDSFSCIWFEAQVSLCEPCVVWYMVTWSVALSSW